MDEKKLFNGHAEAYTAGRPSYAKELIDCLYGRYGVTADSVIADIGSGTGKFAAQILNRGSRVFCVEPNDDMRRTAEQELGGLTNFRSVKGDEADTTLEAGSVDFITTAQAFHWFDVAKFRTECARILKPGGKVFLIWNIRDESDPLNRDMREIYTKYCPNFKGFNGGIVKDDPRIREFFRNGYEFVSFTNPLYLNRDAFILRSLSGSYSLMKGDARYEEYLKAVADVFEKYAAEGNVTIANQSVAYAGSI
ncbi:MAG: methyltransferase domain-containing protein [Lachnospiraceae bacterium]|nr:methyltransferase domain-containing protein [Lachnospiraceae bacterium]